MKTYKQFIKEDLQEKPLREKLSFLNGKKISLTKTVKNGGQEVVSTIDGTIGLIGPISATGDEFTGFYLMNDNNDQIAFVYYRKKVDEFVEGDSPLAITYKGKTEKDQRILQLFKDNATSPLGDWD